MMHTTIVSFSEFVPCNEFLFTASQKPPNPFTFVPLLGRMKGSRGRCASVMTGYLLPGIHTLLSNYIFFEKCLTEYNKYDTTFWSDLQSRPHVRELINIHTIVPLVWKNKLYNQTLFVLGFPFYLGSYTDTMLAQA